MTNPHLIVGPNHRCICGVYNLDGKRTAVWCDDVIKAAMKLANEGNPEGLLIATVLRELIEDRTENEC